MRIYKIKNESLPLTRSIKGFVDYSIQRSSIAMTKWKRFEKKTCNKKSLYYCYMISCSSESIVGRRLSNKQREETIVSSVITTRVHYSFLLITLHLFIVRIKESEILPIRNHYSKSKSVLLSPSSFFFIFLYFYF